MFGLDGDSDLKGLCKCEKVHLGQQAYRGIPV